MKGQRCTECGTTDEACNALVLGRARTCCPRCHSTDTHKGDPDYDKENTMPETIAETITEVPDVLVPLPRPMLEVWTADLAPAWAVEAWAASVEPAFPEQHRDVSLIVRFPVTGWTGRPVSFAIGDTRLVEAIMADTEVDTYTLHKLEHAGIAIGVSYAEALPTEPPAEPPAEPDAKSPVNAGRARAAVRAAFDAGVPVQHLTVLRQLAETVAPQGVATVRGLIDLMSELDNSLTNSLTDAGRWSVRAIHGTVFIHGTTSSMLYALRLLLKAEGVEMNDRWSPGGRSWVAIVEDESWEA